MSYRSGNRISPDLVHLAVAAGHVESTCVRNRGWAGTKDSVNHILVFAANRTVGAAVSNEK